MEIKLSWGGWVGKDSSLELKEPRNIQTSFEHSEGKKCSLVQEPPHPPQAHHKSLPPTIQCLEFL